MAAAVSMSLNPTGLPGSQLLQQLTNAIGFWALALTLIALVISSAAWALGAHSQNYQTTASGKRGVLISIFAALLIGASPALINFFFTAGQQVH